MGFVANALTAVRHPTVGWDYARWRLGEVLDWPLLVKGAFGTQLETSSYAGFSATRCFIPRPCEVAMLRALASHAPLFLDVGANVGVWTVSLAAAHPAAQIYAFEPTPGECDVLRRNLARNRLHNVTPVPMAVSAAAGQLAFQVTPTNRSIFNRLLPTKDTAQDLNRGRFTTARTIQVPSVRLDEFCQERHIPRIGFLKIDVEGGEVAVLHGAHHLLQRHAVEMIYMEVDPDNLIEMGESIDSLAACVGEAGYRFHELQPDGSPGPPVEIRERRSLNLMALPHDA